MRHRILLALGTAVSAALVFASAPTFASTLATPSMGATNSISYTDADFEGSAGDWVNVANSTLTDDATTAFLHTHSLKAVAGTTAAMQFKLGNMQQINVTAGNTQRVGAYFKAPALSGRTITWALGFYNAANTFLGWTSATADTLGSSGTWQYAPASITVPATATYMLGSPRVTEAGQAAGESLNMDEVQVDPLRPAQLMGADAMPSTVAGWESASSSIGPLQEDKIFYPGALPSSYSGSTCDQLATAGHRVVCIIAYKTQNTNLATFISGIPATQAVVFVYHQEPENGDYTSGATFVSEFDGQANAIRSDSGNAPNIMVAMDSTTFGYNPGQPGANCSYVVPPSETDFYLADHYEFHPNGNSFPTGQSATDWNTWLDCVETGSPTTTGTAPKPLGVAEFGFGVNGGVNNCANSGTEATRAATMAADGSYLQGLPATAGAPVDFLDYWWIDNSTAANPCRDWNFPATSATATDWRGFIIQNGGGAN